MLRQVRCGEKISASAWNDIVKTLNELTVKRAPQNITFSRHDLRVLNRSGADVVSLQALKIDGFALEYSSSADLVSSGITLKGIAATNNQDDMFLVALEPIVDGFVGRAAFCGDALFPALISGQELTGTRYAELENTGSFTESSSGNFRIVARDGSFCVLTKTSDTSGVIIGVVSAVSNNLYTVISTNATYSDVTSPFGAVDTGITVAITKNVETGAYVILQASCEVL